MDDQPHISNPLDRKIRRIAALRAAMLTTPDKTHASYWSPSATDLLMRMLHEQPLPSPRAAAVSGPVVQPNLPRQLRLSAATPAHPGLH